MTQHHGGNIYQLNNIIDFSANINPLGVPESVRSAISDALDSVEHYPDPYCTELRNKLAETEQIPAENIVCGNGADDLIYRIAHALKPRKALLCEPSFSEYRKALEEVGCEICEHILTESSSFTITESVLDALDETCDLCFVCSPNNPTGKLISPDILKKLAHKCRENNIILVCDESFMGFVSNSEYYTVKNFLNEKCIIVKAFTKLYAMAGIRLGYAVFGSTDIAQLVQNSGQFWSVSSLAQSAGAAAVEETRYVKRSVELIEKERQFLTSSLSSLGIDVCSSSTNYLLFKWKNGLCKKMLTQGILIRDCSNFNGLSDGYYRIAVRTHDENLRLIDALRRCMNG